MAGAFSQVDLSQLSAPPVVEPLDFETILSRMVADLQSRTDSSGAPLFTALVESDPAFKVLEAAAYEALLTRQRVNEAARAVMLASATGGDLDQIAANFGITRLLVTPADDTVIPPVPAVYEGDADLRARTTLSLEGYTSAGSEGSYVFHALSASGEVKDVSATSPTPGQVVIYVLSRIGQGTAPQSLLDTVAAALNSDRVRPMTDQVSVMSAAIVPYTIQADLVVYPGPDAAVVLDAARAAAADYAASQHRMGFDITLSGVYAALHQPGVQRVNLTTPTGDITVGDGEAAFCTSVAITAASATSV